MLKYLYRKMLGDGRWDVWAECDYDEYCHYERNEPGIQVKIIENC